MIIVIRISGMVDVNKEIAEALYRLKLRRKYSAVLLKETNENMRLLKRIRDFVAYGQINQKTLENLIELRGQLLPEKKNEKIKAKEVASQLDKKSLEELGLKPFFRLHPPRGGIESKKHFGVGKGVLGDNKENINKLLERML